MATTYLVRYGVIGRIAADDQTVTATCPDELIKAITAHASQYASGRLDVYVEPDRMRGGITQFGRPLGSFSLTVVRNA